MSSASSFWLELTSVSSYWNYRKHNCSVRCLNEQLVIHKELRNEWILCTTLELSSCPMPGFELMWALTSDAIKLAGDAVVVTSWMSLGLDGRRPRRPFRLSVLTTVKVMTWMLLWLQWHECNVDFLEVLLNSPSLTMPTARHFWKRQNWHRFRLLLSTGQSLLVRQTYLEFFWTVRWNIRKELVQNGFTDHWKPLCCFVNDLVP